MNVLFRDGAYPKTNFHFILMKVSKQISGLETRLIIGI
jgi:hypothetical protein